MESKDFPKELLGTIMLASFIILPSTLKEKSFTESGGERLNFFVTLKHPDIIEFFSLLHDFVLENL